MGVIEKNGKKNLKQKLPAPVNQDNGIKTEVVTVVVAVVVDNMITL